MDINIYKVVIRDGKYMGEMEAILLLKRKWWKFTWWERKNFARPGTKKRWICFMIPPVTWGILRMGKALQQPCTLTNCEKRHLTF